MGRLMTPRTLVLLDCLVQDELRKRQHYRPIYSVHKWWARRPGTLFRAIILAATQPELADNLLHPTLDALPDARSPYFQSHQLEHLTILDPFMGGGTTLVEANRLGIKVIGCDLNPVAFWTVRETLKPLELSKLDQYFHQLEQTAGETIKRLYQTRCDLCNADHGETMYAFWVRTVLCPHCRQEVPLFKRALLNEGEKRTKPVSIHNLATVFCPHCFALNEWDGQQPAHCAACGHPFDPRTGYYDRGNYTCPACQRTSGLIDTLKNGQELGERLIAIEYWCPRHRRRAYKAPDQADLSSLTVITQQVAAEWDSLKLPHQLIPVGDSSQRWRAHKFLHYYQVFNARQQLALHTLLTAIAAIPELPYREAFLTVLSNILEYNNMMTPYNYPHRKLHHLFTYHALPLTTTPVENSVWGVEDAGAGTFANGYQRYRNAKAYAHRPYEMFRNARGQTQSVFPQGETVAATFVDSFAALQTTPKGALLFCHNSADLPEIPSGSVDFVITDPPYFDNIHYSELSNFFYVWLRLLADHSAFAPDLVPNDAEAIVNAQHDKGEDEYRALMTAVFTEAHRVIKDGGRLIFTFHHSNPRAWWTILAAVGDSGFQVVDTFPLRTEYQVNPHVRGKQALDSDMIFICAKRAAGVAPELASGEADADHAVMRQLGQLLLEVSAAWEAHRLSPEEWERRMTELGELNGKAVGGPEYARPATTQPRLFEKDAQEELRTTEDTTEG